MKLLLKAMLYTLGWFAIAGIFVSVIMSVVTWPLLIIPLAFFVLWGLIYLGLRAGGGV